MQIEIPDELVSRATKAANWYLGKDDPQTQICGILAIFCYDKENLRKIEEAELNQRIKAAKEAKKNG